MWSGSISARNRLRLTPVTKRPARFQLAIACARNRLRPQSFHVQHPSAPRPPRGRSLGHPSNPAQGVGSDPVTSRASPRRRYILYDISQLPILSHDRYSSSSTHKSYAYVGPFFNLMPLSFIQRLNWMSPPWSLLRLLSRVKSHQGFSSQLPVTSNRQIRCFLYRR